LPKKTSSKNPADWLWIAETDLSAVQFIAQHEISFPTCRSKLAEVLEKILKAELIRIGWELEKTHELDRLLDLLVERESNLVASVEPLCDALADVYFTDRYPGFDLDDPDWPKLREQLAGVTALLELVKARLPAS